MLVPINFPFVQTPFSPHKMIDPTKKGDRIVWRGEAYTHTNYIENKK